MARVVIDPAVPDRASLDTEIARLRGLDVGELRARWHTVFRRRAPPHLPRHLLFRVWLIGCKPIGSANWMPTAGVCLIGLGQGHRIGLTGSWLTSTGPKPSCGPGPC